MRLLKKSGIKLVLFVLVCVTAGVCLVMLWTNRIQQKSEQRQINDVIGAIIEEVVKQYPEVEETRLINIVNASKTSEQGKEILKKYGINPQEVSVILALEESASKKERVNVIILLGYAITLAVVFILYMKHRDKKIDGIIEYIQEINRKNYTLKIYDNTEDDFSNLRNELYKITILLKEQALNSCKAQEAIQASVSDISHQLKTPLTSISIMLDNIAENPNMEPETKNKFIHEIRRQMDWMNWLVISLLKLSRLDANAVELKQEPIQVENLIQEVERNLAIGLEVKNQQLIQQGEKEASFKGDWNWQVEALTNIIKNGMEHTKEGKKIYIRWEENVFYTKIEIQDEGEGIPKEEIKHIFERFYRGKNATENSIGIGLALAKSIIEKQNGFVRVKSVPTKGTTFEIKYMKN